MAWNTDRRRLVLVSAAVALLGLVVAASWQVRKALAPRPIQAWVAIEVSGSGMAEIGRVEVKAGTQCTLHAVLEAQTSTGATIYYTEARRLRLDGVEVEADALRRWKERAEVQVMWFTVEGVKPYFEADESFSRDQIGYRPTFRARWPRSWAVPATLDSGSSSFAQGRGLLHEGAFGTQRFHVRIEFYESSEALMPERRFSSWAGDSLPADEARFPTLVATLPRPLEQMSRLFGLPQVEPGPEAPAVFGEIMAAAQRRDLAFSRVGALQALLNEAGVGGADLEWSEVDLSDGPSWGPSGVAVGDLARVGARIVVLTADHGVASRLDREDLCFDFKKGAAVRQLGEVFESGNGLIEWARVTGASAEGGG